MRAVRLPVWLAADIVPGPPPEILSVTPNSGAYDGGTTLALAGHHLQDVVTVTAGPACTGIAAAGDGESVAATTAGRGPDAAGAVDVVVTDKYGRTSTLAGGYTYDEPPPPAPTLTSIDPAFSAGAGGGAMVLTGTGFVDGCVVLFGALEVAATWASSTEASCTIPAGAGEVLIAVRNPDLQTSTDVVSIIYI